MARSTQSVQRWSSFLLLLAIVLGAFGALMLPKEEVIEIVPPEPPALKPEIKTETKVEKSVPKVQPKPLQPKAVAPRKIPIVGSPGEFLVILPDGSTYRETASGKEQLTTPEVPVKPPEVVTVPQVRVPMQLIVLDKGAISIPKNAVVTFLGADHLITHEIDGSSITYFIDGRVIKRDARSRVAQEK